MSINNRISLIISSKSLNKSSFSRAVGFTDAAIGRLIAGKNEPTFKLLLGILIAFPDVSAEWLLRGEGEMFKDTQPKQGGDVSAYLEIIKKQQETIQELVAKVGGSDTISVKKRSSAGSIRPLAV